MTVFGMHAPEQAAARPSTAGGASRHIPSLDGIRAISFLLVFVAHCGLEIIPGGLGVTIFFFLSGYLITTLMRSEFDRNGRVSFSDFWLRRALRILPQFYLVLAAAYGSAVLLGQFHLLQWHILLAQALHVTNYWIIAEGYEGFPNFTGTVVYWSLAVEEHFYVIFPFLYVWMRRRNMAGRQQAVLLLSLCGVIVAWRCWLVLGLHVATDRTYMASDTRIDSILFGCVLAVYRNPVRDRVPGSESLWRILVVPLAVLALLLTLFVRAEWFRETLRYSLQGMALIPLFAAAIRFPGWLVFRWLNWRPVAFLGVLSYSLYLVHFGAIFIVRDALHGAAPVLTGVLAFSGALVVAWILYRFVERPCAVLRRRLVD
jgi:peptidoglycan/LPS O-acetylase OafA/YrhL